MFKKFLAIILTFVMAFGAVSFVNADTEIPEGYTPIYTAEDLNNIRNDLDGKYVLMNDIDLSVYENWEPIGTAEAPFTGELDGDGYSVFNLTITGEYGSEDDVCFALFAQMKNGTVLDLCIIDADINVSFRNGAEKLFRAGVLAGYANGVKAENCIVSGSITLNEFYKGAAGGFFGKENACLITQCVNYTDIKIASERIYGINVGGIAGEAANDTISFCGNYGDITATSFDSNISSRTLKVGGIAGNNFECGIISDCFNQGNISVDFCMPSIYLGGITGECCVVERCYNSGDIVIPENYAGYIGGISGNFRPDGLAIVPAPEINDVYYINDSLSPSYINGNIFDEFFENVKLLTEEEFKSQESFVGFDFENVWEMEENGYPILKNQPEFPENTPEKSTTETTTESTTEPSTEPATEPQQNDCRLEDLWIVRVIAQLVDSLWKVISFVCGCL